VRCTNTASCRNEKSALLEIAKIGDKDAFVDFAETVIAKHAKEKEDMSKKIADVESDHAAIQKVLAHRSERLTQLQIDIEKLQLKTVKWSDWVADDECVSVLETLTSSSFQES
jgi:hypothetical protein